MVQDEAFVWCRSSAFRSLSTLDEQICFLKEHARFTFDAIGLLFGFNRSTAQRRYRAQKAQKLVQNAAVQSKPLFSSPRSFLSNEEEAQVITWIRERQRHGDCPIVHEIRQYAATVRKRRTEDFIEPGRYWWHGFKLRHASTIASKVCCSKEQGRSEVKVGVVQKYLSEALRMLKDIKSLKQVVNMDECGFYQRIDKGRSKKVVYCRDCDIKPSFREETQATTVSLVAAINANGEALKPMYITKERIRFETSDLRLLKAEIVTTNAARGYQTAETMKIWIRKVVGPYARDVRRELSDDEAKIYLIMDNCSTHSTKEVMTEFEKVGNISIIWLPPHASHFLQMLDSSVFGVMKNYYRHQRSNSDTSKRKLEAKILKASRAFAMSVYSLNVKKSFMAVGFVYSWDEEEEAFHLALNMRLITDLMMLNCPDAEQELFPKEWNEEIQIHE